ncbi:TadE/TadG family type IV pilus assembly protein [Allosphingosinicella sp.]|jgi:Flp pilus assembly pilin Flp|uniref:TadE/TadG family type IV pilus assembly protein n=1 Tax=Allosphingosinicella sp. TaxID=2823234 RepID=UPI002F04F088
MPALTRLPIVIAVRGRLAALARDSRGVTLVEFGLLFPILAVMVLGTIDVSRGLSTKFALEQAAQRTIEIASLGDRPQQDYSFLRAHAAAAAEVPIAQVTVSQWLECDNVRQSSFNGVCQGDEQAARYVEISLYQDYLPSFSYGPFASGFANARSDGSLRIVADAGVRVQ